MRKFIVYFYVIFMLIAFETIEVAFIRLLHILIDVVINIDI